MMDRLCIQVREGEREREQHRCKHIRTSAAGAMPWHHVRSLSCLFSMSFVLRKGEGRWRTQIMNTGRFGYRNECTEVCLVAVSTSEKTWSGLAKGTDKLTKPRCLSLSIFRFSSKYIDIASSSVTAPKATLLFTSLLFASHRLTLLTH